MNDYEKYEVGHRIKLREVPYRYRYSESMPIEMSAHAAITDGNPDLIGQINGYVFDESKNFDKYLVIWPSGSQTMHAESEFVTE